MRHLVRIVLAAILVFWIAYAVSPYVALYRLALAVEARDFDTLREAVNLRAVRISLARQLVPEYLKAIERERELRPADRDLAVAVGASVADPLIAQLLSPEALIDLLEDGWPQSVAPEKPENFTHFDIDALTRFGRLLVASETRGFRAFTVTLPEHGKPEEQFRLRLRFRQLGWRVTGIDLPLSLRRSLIRQLPKIGG
jgi:hypothetical protein